MSLAVISRDPKYDEALAAQFEEAGYATGYLGNTAELPLGPRHRPAGAASQSRWAPARAPGS